MKKDIDIISLRSMGLQKLAEYALSLEQQLEKETKEYNPMGDYNPLEQLQNLVDETVKEASDIDVAWVEKGK